MAPLALFVMAHAHPPPVVGLGTELPEHRADALWWGPGGCLVSDADVAWDHRAGGFGTAGRAAVAWRFDDRVWRVDRFVLGEADAGSVDVRIAPLLLGRSVAVDLHYPTTRHRFVDWPGPSAPLPVRLFGQIVSVSSDTLEDGSQRVVSAFDWDGWKRVHGERRVTFADSGTILALDATDRWPNGCTVRSVGEATLGSRGLPISERWRFEGHCPLRDWSADWHFRFGPWRACPSDERP